MGTVHRYQNGVLVETTTEPDPTAEQIDERLEAEADGTPIVVWEMLFFLTNEVRGLKGQSTLTREQFRAAVA